MSDNKLLTEVPEFDSEERQRAKLRSLANNEATYQEYLYITNSTNPLEFEGNSEPITDWDYESPQPEVKLWDTN